MTEATQTEPTPTELFTAPTLTVTEAGIRYMGVDELADSGVNLKFCVSTPPKRNSSRPAAL